MEIMFKKWGVVRIDFVFIGILEIYFRNVDNVILVFGWENLFMSVFRKYFFEWWDGKWKLNGWGMWFIFFIFYWG